ncbi:MAG: relaxase MobL [Clostridiales bacterium]|jgi:hypothetical protein|nr:relaxase MobL [Clostridiales bacterium]
MPKVIFNIAYTSKSPPEKMQPADKVTYMARRSFYDMTAKYNYFSYVLKNEKVVKNKDILEYMQKNSGAFNMRGILSEDEKNEIKKRLAKSSSHIWHGVISFDEETSKGFTTQEKAIEFLKQTFNAFLDRTHLNKNNIELTAALHEDTDNKHIHFTFFEKEPKRRNKAGELCYTSKGTFNPAALENYLVSANMHMSEHSYDYYSARDRAIERLKEIKMSGELQNNNFVEMRQQLKQLSKKLPASGRLQYNSDDMSHLRDDVDDVVNLFIKSDKKTYDFDRQFKAVLALKEKEAKELCGADVSKQLIYVNNSELKGKQVQQLLKDGKTKYIRANKISWENIDYFERLRQDYKARLGNQILGLCKDINRDFKAKNRSIFNDKQKKTQSRIMRRISREAVYEFMKALNGYQKGLQADFSTRLHQVEQEIAHEQSVNAGE